MIGIQCVIFPGGFSGEIGFEVKHEKGEHLGLAPRRYVFDKNKQPIGDRPVGNRVRGYVAIRILQVEEGKVLVSIPDGEVVKIKKDQIEILESAQSVPV